MLRQAPQALKGRRLLTPAASRLPLPAKVMFALAMELLVANRWDMAMCAMHSLVFLMRPGVWRAVRFAHLAPPSAGGSRGLARWGLGIRPRLQQPPPPRIRRRSCASRGFAEQRRGRSAEAAGGRAPATGGAIRAGVWAANSPSCRCASRPCRGGASGAFPWRSADRCSQAGPAA
ncbi:unnamed protein product [Prorocentrum cordatum]|uniref:Anaphase-promoting complex subunit 1 n=1 Tax=Prorocentrum cordatum TaxID=2364126 RepID=A0ABN9RXW7_9DINO|nr:unnamed protein product [Polarella glacialis]